MREPMSPIGKLLFVLGPAVAGTAYLVSSFWLAPLTDLPREPASVLPREAALEVTLPGIRPRAASASWISVPAPAPVSLDENGEKKELDAAASLVAVAEEALTQRNYEAAADAAERVLDLAADDNSHLMARAESVLQQVNQALDQIDAQQGNDR